MITYLRDAINRTFKAPSNRDCAGLFGLTPFSIVLLLGAAASSRAQPRKPVPVGFCELIENRLKYDGKMVEVRGVLDGSPEWLALSGDCRTRIIVQGITFPNAINLTLQLDITSPHYDTADYVVDRTQIEEADRQIEVLQRRHPHAKISVTYIGLFETRPNLVGVNLVDELIRVGFGHLGTYPAQLVIQSARDPRVKSAR